MVNHGSSVAKLGRAAKDRARMLRNLVSSLVEHERIETTINRAKEVRRVADKLVTVAKGKERPEGEDAEREHWRRATRQLGRTLRTPLQTFKVGGAARMYAREALARAGRVPDSRPRVAGGASSPRHARSHTAAARR